MADRSFATRTLEWSVKIEFRRLGLFQSELFCDLGEVVSGQSLVKVLGALARKVLDPKSFGTGCHSTHTLKK